MSCMTPVHHDPMKRSISLSVLGIFGLSACILPARRPPAAQNPGDAAAQGAADASKASQGHGTADVRVEGVARPSTARELKPSGEAKSADPAQGFEPSDGSGTLTLTDVVPSVVSPGTMVEVRGTGFASGMSDNRVIVGGVPWTVRAVYRGRLIVEVPGNAVGGAMEVAAASGNAKFGKAIGVMAVDSAFGRPAPDLHGLIGQVYPLSGTVTALPDFDKAGAPAATVAASTIDMQAALPAAIPTPAGAVGTNFAVRYVGSLNITEGAEYQMCLESDDGSALYLESIAVVDNSGVHKMQKKCEVAYLEPGEYRVDLRYFQGASPSMGLRWTWKKGEGEESVVPSSALYRPE